MKRLLIISYYWPPTGGSGVQRWVKFAKYLPSMGWQPVVYTPSNPEQLAFDESLLGDIPAEAEIIKRPIFEPYAIYRRIVGKKQTGGTRAAGVNPLNSQHKSWKQSLAVFIRGNFFVPDPRAGWVKGSVRFLKSYLKENPVDAVVTTGPPHSMHLIGLGLKKACGVRWIADFRDPWTEMFYFKHLGLLPRVEKKHRRLEQQVLDGCDVVIAVSPLVQADFAARTKTPVRLITNGFDPDDFASGAGESPSLPRGDGKFRVVHTGLFASDGNPLGLWKALADRCAANPEFAAALEIRLAGKTDPEIIAAIREAGLGGNLVDLGYLPHEVTSQEQRGADLLILPLRQEPEYAKVLPGKLFEYLAARRPVMGIGQEDGAAAAVLRDSGAGEMFSWDAREERLLSFLDSVAPETPGSPRYGHGDISRYSRPVLCGRLVSEVLDGQRLF